MGNGVSGILRPNGDFIPCKYGKHYEIAGLINKREELECVVFSSSLEAMGNTDCSAIHWNSELGITARQYEWILNHEEDFDDTQYIYFINPLLKYGSEYLEIRYSVGSAE